MNTSNPQVRRANIEDISKLVELWKLEQMPWEQFEKRFKDFQVAEGEGGELIAAVGFQISGQEAVLHDEVFRYQDQAEFLRGKFWERVQNLSKNHGICRVWTQMQAPYWQVAGFQPANEALLAKLPAAVSSKPGSWLFVQLREETPQSVTLDKEFALFKQAEREETERVFQQAKKLKVVAAVLVTALFILTAVWVYYLIKAKNRKLEEKQDQQFRRTLLHETDFAARGANSGAEKSSA